MKRRKKKKLQEGRQGVADEEQDQTNNGSDDEWTEEEDGTMTDRDDREYKDQEEIEILEDKEITEAYDGSPEAAASAAAAGAASPGPQSISPKLDYDLIPEPGRTAYFKPPSTGGTDEAPVDEEAESSAEDEAMGTVKSAAEPESDEEALDHGSDPGADRQPEASTSAGSETESKQIPPIDVPAMNEERIVFDAWDNRQVKSVNKKAKETIEKAVLELGDHTVDSVFKGSYMAVLNPRSKEFKRFRKLGKHPELMIDPRRWTESTGAAAVRRHCLAEGIDVSSLRASHFVELYYVKDPDLILILAEEANTKQYNVRQLRQAIGDLRETKDDLDSGKAIIKTLDQSLPLLEEPELVALCADKERLLEELSKAERKKILTLVKKRKPGLNEWKKLMDNLEEILNELEAE